MDKGRNMRVIQVHPGTLLSFNMLGLKADEWFRNGIFEHLKNLPKKSQEMRFFNAVSEDTLKKYVNGLDFNNDGVFVIEDNNKIVAFLHAPKINEEELEFALSVLQEYEGKGLGTKMFERAYKWACEKGFKKIVSICLSSNKGMQSIVRKYDDAKIQSVEYNVQEGTIELPDNTVYNPIYAYMSYFTDNIKMFEIGVKRHLNNV